MSHHFIALVAARFLATVGAVMAVGASMFAIWRAGKTATPKVPREEKRSA